MSQPLDNSHVAMLLCSTALAMLDSAVAARVDYLGGWDKALTGQGVLKKRDPGVAQLQKVEERLFFVMHKAVKELEKTTSHLIDRKAPEQIYDLATILIEEIERIINQYKAGATATITYAQGYRQAIADAEQLMFQKRLSRAAALEQLEQNHPQPPQLSAAV